jgi:predicted RNase H-like nuclease (RuvC/YqgF family)
MVALAGTAWAIDPVPATLESLNREVQGLTDQLRETTDKIAALQDRLDTVEKRLGETYRAPSPFDTVERRLEDLEKDVGDLKRR